MSADVRKRKDCIRVVHETMIEFGTISTVINCAGIYSEGPFTQVTEDEYIDMFDTNVKGTLFTTQAAIPFLTRSKGTIVNVASDAAVKGNFNCTLYSASKGAVVAFTRSLAKELAEIPIRVNCVTPGDVWTPMTSAQIKASGLVKAALDAVYPMGRIAEAEEVAQAIYFLSTEYSSYITGAVLPIDGGLTA